MKPMFSLGQIGITEGAVEALERTNILATSIVQRHVMGDWGDVNDQDKRTNELALEMGGRILSSYKLPDHTEIWVTTEPDRSATTVLLPGEQ
jgi:hypothetical protein